VAPVLVVLAFPLITIAGFGLLFAAYRAIGGWPLVARLDAHGFWLYGLLLLIPAGAVASSPEARDVLGEVPLAPEGPQAAAVAAGAVALGVALYYLDLGTAVVAKRVAARRHALLGLLDGREAALKSFRPSPAALLVMCVVVAAAEEVLWRGYLLTALDDAHGWSAPAALAVTSLSFGAVHYYFGLRNVLVKAVHGAAWGLLLLGGAGLLAPVLSHIAFELCVARGLRRPTAEVMPHAAP
jgi:membrane protease YdiL (CAAX protease family)